MGAKNFVDDRKGRATSSRGIRTTAGLGICGYWGAPQAYGDAKGQKVKQLMGKIINNKQQKKGFLN